MTAAFPDEDRWTWLGRVAVIAAWGISGLAWALSYATTASLAAGVGRFHGWEVATFPLTVDLASLAAMVIALDQAKRHGPTRAAWCLSTFAALAMMACNVGAEAGHPGAMLLHAYPPAVAILCWGLLTRYRTSLAGDSGDATTTRRRGQSDRSSDRSGHAPAGVPVGSTASSSNGHGPAARPTPTMTDKQIPTVNGTETNGHRPTYEQARADLENQGVRATDKAVAQLMGCSEKTVQRHRAALKATAASNGSKT